MMLDPFLEYLTIAFCNGRRVYVYDDDFFAVFKVSLSKY